MTTWEVARDINIKERTVRAAIERMRKRFYAVTTTHLVAILIALGFIDPSTFVPMMEEQHRAANDL